MPPHTFLCLFDLHAYDTRVAPALRQYAHKYDPAGVVALLHDAGEENADNKHWADSIAPDAGHKPSDQTVAELAGMLIRQYCLPQPPIQVDKFVPWLSDQSEWFADLMNGGEELAGGSLEFPYGTGRLTATRQQIAQFLDEVNRIAPPKGELAADYLALRKMLAAAQANTSYTVLLCLL